MIQVALLQTDIHFKEPLRNFETVGGLFEEAMAARQKPDVVILPEDWSCGFSQEMFHHMADFIEPEGGPSVSFLRDLARRHRVWVVGGSIGTQFSDGKMRNTTFLIDREGNIAGDYSKTHLYSDMDEDLPYSQGDRNAVFETEWGKVAFMICYDIRFCELSRGYALEGAEALIVTSNFPNPRLNHWKTLLTARAIENQMFVIACNRVGTSPMGSYFGHSLVIDPFGEILAEGGEKQEIVTAQVDFSAVKTIRETIHMFRDRQPHLYSRALLTPNTLQEERREALRRLSER
ncbi:carbon-nitrogen family hydrolase [Aminithiophilus ramosus]|uniref:Carbon-nitrogen family hydrolase n=2 Tax=Synergistales TaxID=649776 RepID=A0A9Q7AF61_9BACT|nr:carbon-nitrogen family hydrolase [Aminithiophilus ramosus]QTX33104.1 carbon-nitrogen family hydrolase [Aminithiophilus ramosus]QVL37134.1 carbon-nitrogen family hydrolase [Synergistota bacterium]